MLNIIPPFLNQIITSIEVIILINLSDLSSDYNKPASLIIFSLCSLFFLSHSSLSNLSFSLALATLSSIYLISSNLIFSFLSSKQPSWELHQVNLNGCLSLHLTNNLFPFSIAFLREHRDKPDILEALYRVLRKCSPITIPLLSNFSNAKHRSSILSLQFKGNPQIQQFNILFFFILSNSDLGFMSHVCCNLQLISFFNIARKVARKTSTCNTSFRTQFYFFQRLE